MTPAIELLARLRSLDVHVRAEGGRLRINAPKGRLTPELEAALTATKDELLGLLEREPSKRWTPELTRVSRSSPLRPSFIQERLWVLDRLRSGGTAYNLATLARVDNALDLPRLMTAVRRVTGRHEILRSRFVLDGDTPAVHIGPIDDVPVDLRDLRAHPEAEHGHLLELAVRDAVHRPFDLANEPPVRFSVLQTRADGGALLFSAHHIAVDAWSVGLLMREIGHEYEAVGAGTPDPEPPALQYVDYAHWQRALMVGEGADERLEYWRHRLAGLPQLTTFPPDRPRSNDGASAGATHSVTLPVDLYEALRIASRDLGATLYMTLFAVLAIILGRRTGQTDVAIGSPLGTRERADLETIIGPIVNPLVLRLNLADDPSFEQLVGRVRDAVLEGHANQDVPFEAIVRELNPERALGHAPLFQVALVMHNTPGADQTRIVGGGAIYDVTVFATEHGGSLGLTFEYRTDLYEPSTVERIADHFASVLSAAVRGRSRRTSELGGMGPGERSLILDRFNQTQVDVDRSTLLAQFACAAAAHGNDVAVVAGDATLTYAALNRLSSAVARRLREHGAGPGCFVALATDRTGALPAAALGIMKSGAAYVPIDLSYPPDRISFMLRDSGAGQIVTTRAMLASLATVDTSATVITVDDLDAAAIATGSDGSLPGPNDVAYLMYTSGSTGTPKGVLVPHSAVSNFLGAMRASIGFTDADVLLSVTSPSFDISVLELFLPLVQGGRLVVAGRDVVADGHRLAEQLSTSGATLLQSTPSGWRLLMNAQWPGDARVRAIVGGEPLPPALAEWLRPRVRTLWNAYGPTETTVWSTLARLDDGDAITIGTPIANTRIYVLDAHGLPAPIGAPGEICIAGDGVADGYHGRPDLTSERFVADVGAPGATMYRTGDIGRWRADGRLDHLGRVDGQVKVRGHRIETGEIEAALEAHEAVKEAVVGVHGASSDDPRLVAWVQLHDDQDSTGSELRRYLRQRLPEFMVPSMIVPVDAFPLTPNGKTDRRALPDVFAAVRPLRTEDTPPSTPTERVIADIWMRLLGIDRLAVSDSFFELGGHSLLAMRAAAEITSRTGRVIDPRLLFLRTLGQVAEACDALPPTRGDRP